MSHRPRRDRDADQRDVLADAEAQGEVEAEIPLGPLGRGRRRRARGGLGGLGAGGYVVGATIFVDGGMTLYPNFV